MVNKNVPPAWARKNSITSTSTGAPAESSAKETKPVTKVESNDVKTAPILKKPALASAATPKENGETTKTAKLQSKEIKVPIVVQHKKPAPPPLTKPEPMIKNTTPKMTVLREPAKPKPKEPSPESESEEEEEEVEEEEEEVTESEEGSTEYETETESEEDTPAPPPPPVKKPEPKREPSPTKPKLPVQLKKVSRSPSKTDTDSVKSSKSEKSSSPEPKPFFKPPLKKVVRPPVAEPKERSTSPEPQKNFRVQLRKVPSSLKAPRLKEKLPEVQLKKVEKPLLEDLPKKKEEAYPHKPSTLRSESSKRIPPPPPMPKSNIPPPPPPPPKLGPPTDFKKDVVSEKQKEVIEKLKSQPIIHSKSITKVKDQFIFETEKATVHNVLLKEINAGVRLRTVKCNDRSKPNLEGLRKFRRQMTLEEQLAKSESRANLEAPPPDEEEVDEMDDIDRVRDDLQSTKQLLAMELRNNEALERENKRLAQRVSNLEAELSRERWNPMGGEEKTNITGADAELIKSLKGEAQEAQKQSKQLEEKYQTVAKELDTAFKQSEEQKRKIAELERKLALITDDDFYLNEPKGISTGDSHAPRRSSEAAQKESSPELAPDEEEEEEEEEDEEKKAEKVAKRLNREVNMLSARLMRLKEKQEEKHAERQALKYAMRTNQYALKNEQKKYKKLQKEVDKMAAMMKLEDEDEDGEEPKELPPEEPEEEEEEEESEEESESESESGSECESANEAEDAPDDKKKVNLEPRVKRHEGRLASLKKGNYLLQANVDRIKDEINKIREMCCTLQSDLDSVIADLG